MRKAIDNILPAFKKIGFKRLALLPVFLVLVVLLFGIAARTWAQGEPGEPRKIPKFNIACPEKNLQHWDKIVFKRDERVEGLLGFRNAKGDFLLGTLDIKVLDDPNTVAKLENKVADKLKQLGYVAVFFARPERAIEPIDIEIVDVEYAIVCVQPLVVLPPPGQGP